MSKLLAHYFQDVENDIEGQYLEEEELNYQLETEFEKVEEEKFSSTLSQILEIKKEPKKKRIIKKRKTKKIKVVNKPNIIEKNSKVDFSVEEKIIKNFKTSDAYSNSINYKPGNIVSSSSEIHFEDISSIKRKNFALGFDGSTIFIHGGENEEKKLDDLIFYELGEWFSFDFENEFHPPALSNHFMICIQGNLYLFDDFENYYNLNYHKSSPSWNKLLFKSGSKKIFEKVEKVTPVLQGDTVYIFGGMNSANETVSNSMILICPSTDHSIIKEVEVTAAPEARYNYSCQVQNQNSIIYFGGQNGEKFFNDLHLFNTQHFYFTQIDCYGLVPPPLHSSILYSFNSHDEFYIHGGHGYNSIESSIYKFSLSTKKWESVINSEDLNSFPIAGHKSVILHPYQKNFYIVGGYIDLEERLAESSIKILNFMEFQQNQNSYESIIKHTTNLYQNKKMTNFSFIFKQNNEADIEIKVHKEFISSRCDYLKELIKQGESSVVIADFEYDTFKLYIEFLYTGKIKTYKQQIKNLLELGKRSGKQFLFLNQIFKMNLYLNSNLDFYKQLQSDLYSFKNLGSFTDAKINLIENDEIIKSYNAHKFMLFRSKHFEDAFNSGMKETIESEIDFIGISEISMDTILHYLYTNECIPSPQNAVEVLVHCDLFRLDELASNCRALIKSHLSVENILDLASFAGLYNDQYLIDFTARFLSSHFDEFTEDCLDELPSNFKLVFFGYYSKKVKKNIHQKMKKDRAEEITLRIIQQKNMKSATTRDGGTHGARKLEKWEKEIQRNRDLMSVDEYFAHKKKNEKMLQISKRMMEIAEKKDLYFE
eukprot:gene692-8944_t